MEILPRSPNAFAFRLHTWCTPRLVNPLLRDRAQQRHIRACTKSASCPGEDNHANILIALRLTHRCAHLAVHDGRPCIQFIRPVQRKGGHSVGYVVQRFLIWHGEPDYIQWRPR